MRMYNVSIQITAKSSISWYCLLKDPMSNWKNTVLVPQYPCKHLVCVYLCHIWQLSYWANKRVHYAQVIRSLQRLTSGTCEWGANLLSNSLNGNSTHWPPLTVAWPSLHCVHVTRNCKKSWRRDYITSPRDYWKSVLWPSGSYPPKMAIHKNQSNYKQEQLHEKVAITLEGNWNKMNGVSGHDSAL